MTDKVLIRVANGPEVFNPEVVFPNARRNATALTTKATNEDMTDLLHYNYYEVDLRDVDISLAELTTRNPGKEVIAYLPHKTAMRPPGELVIRSITENGVLP